MKNKVIKKYDKNKNMIYFKNSEGREEWREYDENNKLVHYKSSTGYEYWWKFETIFPTLITQQEFKQIERIKLYLNNKKCSRFSLMDI